MSDPKPPAIEALEAARETDWLAGWTEEHDHQALFDALPVDPELERRIAEDLQREADRALYLGTQLCDGYYWAVASLEPGLPPERAKFHCQLRAGHAGPHSRGDQLP